MCQDLTTSGPAESFYFADGSLAQAKVEALRYAKAHTNPSILCPFVSSHGLSPSHSRTHAQAIAGRPLSTSFNATTNVFSLSYQYDASVSAPTVVYLNKPMYERNTSYPSSLRSMCGSALHPLMLSLRRYPSGYSVQVSPGGSVDWTFSNNQLLFLPSTNSSTHLADGTTVTIQVAPAFP
jgi:hypothetical protein